MADSSWSIQAQGPAEGGWPGICPAPSCITAVAGLLSQTAEVAGTAPAQVEQYFGALLPQRYWLGASRAGIGSEYTLTDGLQIPQVSRGWGHRGVGAE